MGLVLAFETAPRPAARPAPRRAEPAQSADILFFTGVRYEREGLSSSSQAAPEPDRAEPTPAS